MLQVIMLFLLSIDPFVVQDEGATNRKRSHTRVFSFPICVTDAKL